MPLNLVVILKDQQNKRANQYYTVSQPTCDTNDNSYVHIHTYIFSACVQHMCLSRSS